MSSQPAQDSPWGQAQTAEARDRCQERIGHSLVSRFLSTHPAVSSTVTFGIQPSGLLSSAVYQWCATALRGTRHVAAETAGHRGQHCEAQCGQGKFPRHRLTWQWPELACTYGPLPLNHSVPRQEANWAPGCFSPHLFPEHGLPSPVCTLVSWMSGE